MNTYKNAVTHMHEYATGKTIWFLGEVVKLTGHVDNFYGSDAYRAIYKTGHKRGTVCHVVDHVVISQLERDYGYTQEAK